MRLLYQECCKIMRLDQVIKRLRQCNWKCGAHGKLKVINRTMVVKRCKITWDTLTNNLMVAKHKHKQSCITFANTQNVVRPSLVHCTALIWVTVGCVWILHLSNILRRLDATNKTHAMNARARTTYMRARWLLKNTDCKVL